MRKALYFLLACIVIFILMMCTISKKQAVEWTHLSTAKGDLAWPNNGAQQTSTAVLDIDKNGINDFVISERSMAPSVVWYRRTETGWNRYIIDDTALRIDAGSAQCDIDRDGDLDLVFAGDGSSPYVWWWENPYPNFQPDISWKRREIKNFGANKHHDQLFGDFDGDNQPELVFWNQGAKKLYLADIPENPKENTTWDLTAIYSYSSESEPVQHGQYPTWKGVNEHEGLAKGDIDGDGKIDIVGGGLWFKQIEGYEYTPNVIDESYHFSRSAVGQLIEGGRPEIVMVVGDGRAPMIMYKWKEDAWIPYLLIDAVQDGHSLDIVDFNGDGFLDIFNAEMRLGENPGAKTRILYGDGKGNFNIEEVLTGYGLHESRIADLDGDGDYDILGKPYKWESPRLDIWLNN